MHKANVNTEGPAVETRQARQSDILFGIDMERDHKMKYRYSWGPRFCVPGLPVLDRKGQFCRVLARGAMNSALVEFADGYQAVISRNALRKVT
jgi:hypothetical protein